MSDTRRYRINIWQAAGSPYIGIDQNIVWVAFRAAALPSPPTMGWNDARKL
ncbi:hypothetical protein [Asanoa siamensis]|uniref:hypothetical protein n=1 Tax=Asanoa siamensis TaxID=926357 RepID=UPI0019409359|nr:hypothetical protein [Asanoa siamensis]